jgi:hypothetical protein
MTRNEPRSPMEVRTSAKRTKSARERSHPPRVEKDGPRESELHGPLALQRTKKEAPRMLRRKGEPLLGPLALRNLAKKSSSVVHIEEEKEVHTKGNHLHEKTA